MSKSLPPRPNIDRLKHEARRILRSVRHGDDADLPTLRLNPTYANASADEIRDSVTLLEVQHALARDYGFPGWAALKKDIESRTPVLHPLRPVLKVGPFDQVRDHYQEWLGFDLLWEWREAPGRPAIAAFARDGIEFMTNEHEAIVGPTELHLDVTNLPALVDEWNERRPGAAKIRTGMPYEFPEVRIKDPWRNVFVFEGKDQAAMEKQHAAVRSSMRDYVRAQLEAGRELPTPEEIRDVVGPPLGAAIDVLNEFPGYAEVFEARQSERRDESD